MRLILVEAENGKSKETALPESDRFTIGRGGDIIPTIPSAQLLSRIHATVINQKDGTWKVIDGDGVTPSRNGLWTSPTDRVTEFIISAGEEYVDLLPFGTTVLMVRVAGSLAPEIDRSTTGLEQHSLNTLHEELAKIKEWQVQQTARTENIEQQLSVIKDISGILTKLDAKIESITVDNTRQDEQIKKGHWMLRGIGLAVCVMLAGASIDKDRRASYIDVALSLAVSGGVGATVISSSKERRELTKS